VQHSSVTISHRVYVSVTDAEDTGIAACNQGAAVPVTTPLTGTFLLRVGSGLLRIAHYPRPRYVDHRRPFVSLLLAIVLVATTGSGWVQSQQTDDPNFDALVEKPRFVDTHPRGLFDEAHHAISMPASRTISRSSNRSTMTGIGDSTASGVLSFTMSSASSSTAEISDKVSLAFGAHPVDWGFCSLSRVSQPTGTWHVVQIRHSGK